MTAGFGGKTVAAFVDNNIGASVRTDTQAVCGSSSFLMSMCLVVSVCAGLPKTKETINDPNLFLTQNEFFEKKAES